MKIDSVRVIKHFKSEVTGEIHGIYECMCEGKCEVFIRKGYELGILCLTSGPITSSIGTVKKEVAEEVINQIDSTICFNNKGVMCQECRYSRVTFNSKKVKQYNGPIVYCTLHKEFVPHGDSCISFDKKE